MDLKQLVDKYSNDARVARPTDKVYKDECVYTFDTAETSTGLFVCLKTFIGVGKPFLPVHFAKTQSHLYLHIRTSRIHVPKKAEEAASSAPTKLAIGVDGGFDLNEQQFQFHNQYSLYIYPEDQLIDLGDDETSSESWNTILNDKVRQSVESVRKAESYLQKEELASQAAAWDGSQRFASKHSQNLLQLPNPPAVSPDPNQWKCEHCDIRKNLWLNLTDGLILCGRRQLDGSGGNNHAVEHYQKTKYPLAVKLGTITAQGADVYSYDEDDMVEDANLAIHLSHFGINMSKMQKTEKTMTELEIDLNQKVGEWDRIQESGSKLVPVYGPGYTGMRNLGNSCYMNSVMQLLFTLPEFEQKYVRAHDQHAQLSQQDPSGDFNFQMAKLGYGLLSGRYSIQPSSEENKILQAPNGIKPTVFKSLIGRGHPEFSTKRQQDAHEYLIHLFQLIERNLRTDPTTSSGVNPLEAFKFKLVDRFECSQSHQVRYKDREDYCLSVPVNKETMINKEQVAEFEKRKREVEASGGRLEPGDIVRPEIRLEDCLRAFVHEETIAGFYSSAVKASVDAIKTTGFGTLPDYLAIQVKKFEHAADWTPIKLDISLQVPDMLDLNSFRSTGIKAGEVQLPEEDQQPAQSEIQINEDIVSQLVAMGFSLEGSKRSAYNTREANNAEAAVNWAVAHMEDSDFNSPFEIKSSNRSSPSNKRSRAEFDDDQIGSITQLGFTRDQAVKALKTTDGNLERAVDWIFNHPDELMDTGSDAIAGTSEASNAAVVQTGYRDGDGVYTLAGFISHMGTNANVGHYVVHLLRDGKWVIYNDENVALSENPPRDLAYLYLYKRVK